MKAKLVQFGLHSSVNKETEVGELGGTIEKTESGVKRRRIRRPERIQNLRIQSSIPLSLADRGSIVCNFRF